MIDVIVPNYNGQSHLETCLAALQHQTRHADMRVTVVDDASRDDSVAFVRTNYPEVQLLVLPHNQGFVAACNAAIATTVTFSASSTPRRRMSGGTIAGDGKVR